MTYNTAHLWDDYEIDIPECGYGVPGCTGTCGECRRENYDEQQVLEERYHLDTFAWIRAASETELLDEIEVQLKRSEEFLEENYDVTEAMPAQLRVVLLLRELNRRLAA